MINSPNLALVREIFKRVDEYRATSGSLSSVTLTVTEFDALRSALRAQPSGDWVWVPKEPTEVMLEEGSDTYFSEKAIAAKLGMGELLRLVYRAMLSAAKERG